MLPPHVGLIGLQCTKPVRGSNKHLCAHGWTGDAMVQRPERASKLVACTDAGELPLYTE
jgi:hypothetical protein